METKSRDKGRETHALRYAYENRDAAERKPATATETQTGETAAAPSLEPSRFSFSHDLQELESSLKMNRDESARFFTATPTGKASAEKPTFFTPRSSVIKASKPPISSPVVNTPDPATPLVDQSLYASAQTEPPVRPVPQATEAALSSVDMDRLAEQIAGQVADYWQTTNQQLQDSNALMQEALNTATRELQTLQRDNEAMATHIERLDAENEQIHKALAHYEIELARFRPIAGNLHFKL